MVNPTDWLNYMEGKWQFEMSDGRGGTVEFPGTEEPKPCFLLLKARSFRLSVFSGGIQSSRSS